MHLRAVKVKGPLNPDAWEKWFPQMCAGVWGVPRRQVRPEQSGAEREDVKLGEDGGRGAERRAREPAVRLERFGLLSRGAASSEDTQSPSSGQSSKKFRSQNRSHPATVIGGGF